MNSLWTELRKIPMLPLSGAVVVGVLFALHVDVPPGSLLATALVIFVIAIVLLLATNLRAAWMASLLVLLVAIGAYRATIMLDRETRCALARLGDGQDPVTVTGRVQLPASDAADEQYVVLSGCLIRSGSIEIPVSHSRVRLYADGQRMGRLKYGDLVYAVGQLHSGRQMLGTRGSVIRSLVQREAGSVYADSTTLFTAATNRWSVRRTVDELRTFSRRVFDSRLSPDGAAVCRALLLGDRGEFGHDFTNNLRVTGLSHIFALSGMNTGLVMLVVWVAMSWLPIPHSARLWILLATALLYMEIGREAPSLVRSSLAAGAMIAGNLLHRRAVFLNLVLAAMFLELLWKPLDLVDAGFILSYLAVFGIVGGYSWLRRFVLRAWKRPLAGLKLAANIIAGTVSAQIGTLPMVGYMFHRVPVTGVIGNLIVVPGFAFLLILAVILLILDLLLPWLAGVVASAANGVAWALASVVNLSARLPLASLSVPPFNVWILLALCGAALIMFLGLALRRSAWSAFGILLAGNVLVWGGKFHDKAPVCAVTFLDVENGDATLISAGERHVLVDAGPAYGSWTAAQRILPVLAERRIERLDALILTHPDNDHTGGVANLLLEVPVDRIYTNGERGASRTALEIELAAARRNREFESLAAGQMLDIAPGVRLTVFSPDSARLANAAGDNEKSLVIRLDANGSSMLLPADIDSGVEADLAAWGPSLNVDLIKSPHHGAKRSTSNALLEMTTPQVCIISSGRRNPFGHPAPEVISRLTKHHVEIHNTAREGTFTFMACKSGWERIPSDIEMLAKRWKLL